MKLTKRASKLANIFAELKKDSGSHSPSLDVLCESANLSIEVDACFLSNPYATDLFMSEFESRRGTISSLRSVFENYPPQNRNIAELVGGAINVAKEKILVGNGAQQIIEWLLSRQEKSIIALPIPTYSSYYESIAKTSKMAFFETKENEDFVLNIKDYSKFISDTSANVAVLINPNNPNGGYIAKDQLYSFCKQNTHLDLILVDDSFAHFAYEDLDFALVSNASLEADFSNVVVIKSMSKDLGVAGIRAGYAIMSPDLVDEALSNGFLWNSNGFAFQFFDIMSSPSFNQKYEVARKKYIMNTLHMYKELTAIKGLKVYPSMSNFFLVRIEEEEKGSFGFNLLAEHGVYVRNCDDKIGLSEGFYRVASRSFEENQLIVSAIRNVMK